MGRSPDPGSTRFSRAFSRSCKAIVNAEPRPDPCEPNPAPTFSRVDRACVFGIACGVIVVIHLVFN